MKKYFTNLLLFKLFVYFNLSIGLAATFDKDKLLQEESSWEINGDSFKLCRIDSNGAMPIYKKKKMKIFFFENSDFVGEYNTNLVKSFLKKIPKNTFRLDFVGHADQCGNYDDNIDLSRRRAQYTWFEVKDDIPKHFKTYYDAKGEQESHDHSRDDKFVEIIATYSDPIKEFKKIVILDISGSLDPRNYGRTDTGYTLKSLQDLKFEPGTIVYVARDPRYECQGTNLKNYSPVGEDYYNHAMLLFSKFLNASKMTGEVYTDYGDIKNNKATKKTLNAAKNVSKITWYIY